MKDKLYYYNRNGELKLTLNGGWYFSETSDLLDWSWSFDELFGKMRGFYRNKGTYKLIIGIGNNDPLTHDAICDIFTEDIVAGECGRLVLRGWGLDCFVIDATHGMDYYMDFKNEYTVQAVDSTWTRENTRTFNGIAGGGGDEDLGRDYTYNDAILGRGYTYSYSVAESYSAAIHLTGHENGYSILIYGPQTNPVIYLNNKPVRVYTEIDEGEMLEIVSNGSIKTIKVLSSSGAESDAFIYRDKENNPFMTLGEYVEVSYGRVHFDFTTIERRSQPTWS